MGVWYDVRKARSPKEKVFVLFYSTITITLFVLLIWGIVGLMPSSSVEDSNHFLYFCLMVFVFCLGIKYYIKLYHFVIWKIRTKDGTLDTPQVMKDKMVDLLQRQERQKKRFRTWTIFLWIWLILFGISIFYAVLSGKDYLLDYFRPVFWIGIVVLMLYLLVPVFKDEFKK